jgi:L-ascorbate metabolism protein UlaG (beta-lactamase superfamily)
VGDRLTFLGHSTVLVDLDGVRVLTGPLLGHLDLASLRALPGHPALIVPASLGRVVAKVAHGVIHEMRVRRLSSPMRHDVQGITEPRPPSSRAG